jgi:hypothetical protein
MSSTVVNHPAAQVSTKKRARSNDNKAITSNKRAKLSEEAKPKTTTPTFQQLEQCTCAKCNQFTTPEYATAKVMLPPGEYYIGDPCYVIADDTWTTFCGMLFNRDNYSSHNGMFEFDGHKLWCHTTLHGDGCFGDDEGRRYHVDAGLLAMVPLALCKNLSGLNGATIIKTTVATTCSAVSNDDAQRHLDLDFACGDLKNHIVISTGVSSDYSSSDEEDSSYSYKSSSDDDY